MDDLLNKVHHADIFDLCARLPDQSVDMILCDLPYGVTACEWDVRIPMEPMWQAFKRVIKPRGAIVLTATNPFAAELIMSNRDWFKYEWVWVKTKRTMVIHAKNRPLLRHESVLVFSSGVILHKGQSLNRMRYYPQKRKGLFYCKQDRQPVGRGGAVGKRQSHHPVAYREYSTRFPDTVLQIKNVNDYTILHPTQKPVALFEYLIRTYTQPGETVFDPCVGSGTTAIAARNCGRNFVVGDMLAEYVQVARERLAKPYTMPMFDAPAPDPQPEQLAMFSEEE